MVKINAVVVTYNRKDLLIESIEALLRQTYTINKIYIIDNASTDETVMMINEKFSNNNNISLITLSKNYGGAGGFYYGIRKAYLDGCDWVWAMDDDTIPENTALEEMIKSIQYIPENCSFLASSVFGPNNEPMNVPAIDTRPTQNGYSDWYRYLDKGIVKIDTATLVSLLFKSEAIEKCGAPHPDFFIWGDDSEYTKRLTTFYGPAFFIGKSHVLHKRYGAKNLSIVNENNPNKIKMYHYYFTNNYVVNDTYYGKKQGFRYLLSTIKTILQIVFSKDKLKGLKSITILNGLKNYYFGNYGRDHFNNRFNNVEQDLLHEDQ